MKNHHDKLLSWMFATYPNYERVGRFDAPPSLAPMQRLCAYLGHPERALRCIHVAGTNGKGSVTHMLASLLMAAGYRTGYTASPHLIDVRERICIDGVMIDEAFVRGFLRQHAVFLQAEGISFFEVITALGFVYFQEQDVDIAVYEVGLGGTWDATNVISPAVSVITNVSLDHTDLLGNTIAEIAGEKAGIMKSGVPVVIGRAPLNTPERRVFAERAAAVGAPITWAQEDPLPTQRIDLPGLHQRENARTACAALRAAGIILTREQKAAGLAHVVEYTGLRGRWEVVSQEPCLTVADVAHNPDSARTLTEMIQCSGAARVHIIWGMLDTKDIAATMRALPGDALYYLTQIDHARSASLEDLMSAAVAVGLSATTYDTPLTALAAAQAQAGPEDLIVIAGSTYIVSAIITSFDN